MGINKCADTDFKDLINGLPEGVSFTILSDSSLSGALIDKGTEQIGVNQLEMEPKPFPYMTGVKTIDFNAICEKLNSSLIFVEQEKTISGMFKKLFAEDMSLKFNPRAVNDYVIPAGKGTLMSGCLANETSFDTIPNGKAYGAFTNALQQVIESQLTSGDKLTNKLVVAEARKVLRHNGFKQLPCLYSSNSNATALFMGGFASR
ncbi:hypothetical protein V6N13_113463 [Hibiscus sabdariffa]|uniref:Peptidase C14 caspase domain-containing protein n=1 Tax=Hibiscus sabdariffa TaxID=183260 RepID=A0ABR2CV54_9ROSI